LASFRGKQEQREFGEVRRKNEFNLGVEKPPKVYYTQRQMVRVKIEKAYAGKINPRTKKKYTRKELTAMITKITEKRRYLKRMMKARKHQPSMR
jgi:hypothetical protein